MDNHKLQTDKPQADTAAKKTPHDDKKVHHDLERLSEEESKQERISTRAYQLWQERGCPEGCADEDWYRAESEMTTTRSMRRDH